MNPNIGPPLNTLFTAPSVGIIMGSKSDIPSMKPASDILDLFEIPYEFTIVSAHRTPERTFHYAKTAQERGICVIIAGAGGAAHLPGVVASISDLPVIGVPIASKHLKGKDSLYSIIQMPRGVPVATVGIDNSTNAALLAVRILSLLDKDLQKKLRSYKNDSRNSVFDHIRHLSPASS